MTAALRARLARALLMLVGVAGAVPAAAQTPAVHDTQAWVLLLGQLPIGERWIAHTELQPRWNDDLGQRDQVLLRGAIGRRVGTSMTVWGGYAYIPRWSGGGVLHEQRTWQQLSATLPKIGAWTPSIRLRPEQRYLDAWGDSSHRMRALGRLVRPLGTSGWSVAVWDEWFVNLDDTVGGPQRGYDQNRLLLTTLRKISRDVTFEGGYVWQHVPGTSTRADRHGHTLFAWLTYAPPAR